MKILTTGFTFILKRSLQILIEWGRGQISSRMIVGYMLYIEVLNIGIYIGKQNQENILLNWLSFYENQSRHIYLYHDILDVKKKDVL